MKASNVTALRMERQHLYHPVPEEEYDALFREMSPVPTEYWCAPGSPPSLPGHVDFDDGNYNFRRRSRREIRKGRFAAEGIAYAAEEDWELFACLYRKEIKNLSFLQQKLLELLKQEGPMNIGLIKEFSGLLVKEITPALHKLQSAFLVYEDQQDSEGDRGWYLFETEFPDVDLCRYTRQEALQHVLPRFARLSVFFSLEMAHSFFRLPAKELNAAIAALEKEKILEPAELEGEKGWILSGDREFLEAPGMQSPPNGVLLLQRNDFWAKTNEFRLKEEFSSQWDVLCWVMIDGSFRGAVTGKFRFGPHQVEEVILGPCEKEALSRQEEILSAVAARFGSHAHPIFRRIPA